MNFKSVTEIAIEWGISERSVRNYCAQDKIPGAFLVGKTWSIPEKAQKPARQPRTTKATMSLLETLTKEKNGRFSNGIYQNLIIDFTYHSMHVEGGSLSYEQTKQIFERNAIGCQHEMIPVDDIIETTNHFRCFDYVLETIHKKLSEKYVKELHVRLKEGTSQSRKAWYGLGEYKKYEVHSDGKMTAIDNSQIVQKMKDIIDAYHAAEKHTLQQILELYCGLEELQPFQDGNGSLFRLLLFKECLANSLTPFVIEEDQIIQLYRGIQEWREQPDYLLNLCANAQNKFMERID